jgi:AraC family transcriptional regulator
MDDADWAADVGSSAFDTTQATMLWGDGATSRHVEAVVLRIPRGLSSKALARARQFMDEHLGNNFTLDQLAKAACVSRAHFARLFRISTGTTPMAYLLGLRIERAKQLLSRQQRVSDVAAALGFCDQSHFSRVFRRSTGLTPREFARISFYFH